MENLYKRRSTLAVTLALLCCLGTQVFTSCAAGGSGEDTGTQNVSAATETEAETTSNFGNLPEDLDLDGRTVTILSRLYERYENELTVESLSGDVVNDAVYNRLTAVQDRLNVVVDNHKEMGTNAAHGALEIITKSILAGDDEYDVYVGSMYNSTAASGGWGIG